MKKMFFSLFFLIVLFNRLFAVDVLINQPGVYEFGTDIISNPSNPNDAIIRIDVGDVVVNFRDHSLSQDPSNTQPGLLGIVIASNVSNVIIKNGTIRDITGKGIVVNPGCRNIVIENVNIENCGLRGIEFAGTLTCPIQEGTIKDSRIINIQGDTALLLQHTNAGTIEDSIFFDNGTIAFDHTVITLTNASRNQFIDCEINNCNGKSLKGFHCANSLENVFNNCRVIANKAHSASLYGFLVDTASNGNVFENCVAESNNSNGGFGFELVGFAVNGCDFCNFTLCTSRLNTGTATAGVTYGFKINDAKLVNLIDCVSSRNSHLIGRGDAYGIFWENNFMCAALNCLSESNEAKDLGIGMQVTNCEQCEVRGCQFFFNTGEALKRGLRVQGGKNQLFLSNVAFSNGKFATEQVEGLGALETSDLNTAAKNLTTVTNPWINIRAFIGLPL